MTDIEQRVRDARSTRGAAERIQITDPADGQELFAAPVASFEQVRDAVGAARAAARQWAGRTAADRGAALARAADALEQHATTWPG
jgi:acyl-CoA reductase-like NAD-dependent aldehyde dehydrogenase